jgi:hypothetical protein
MECRPQVILQSDNRAKAEEKDQLAHKGSTVFWLEGVDCPSSQILEFGLRSMRTQFERLPFAQQS